MVRGLSDKNKLPGEGTICSSDERELYGEGALW